jgi:hypothetical protein
MRANSIHNVYYEYPKSVYLIHKHIDVFVKSKPIPKVKKVYNKRGLAP